MSLSEQDIKQLNAMENFLSWESTWDFKQFIHCNAKIIGLFTGNQRGKTAGCAYQYVLRILGAHPVPEKNILYFECPNDHKFSVKTRPEDNVCPECKKKIKIHERRSRAFRFCSETLPSEKGDTGKDGSSAETKNTVYPEFKKWLPSFLIKKDITFRTPMMVVKDPFAGSTFGDIEYEGEDIIVDFVSYNQSAQSTAGVQRLSIWCDEEPPSDFYKEQLPRLLAEKGDFIISLTPANYISWTYDEIFEKARVFYRSKAICDYLNKEEGSDRVKQIEYTDSPLDMAVIQAATDDNPTLSIDEIDLIFENYDDPDDIAIRRYGVFKQVSGRIFKDFEFATHLIKKEKYFPDGIPHSWVHARGIDYHPQTPWAFGMMSLSPTNEAFIWGEFNPSPEKMTTREIARQMSLMGGDYNFRLNLIDPLCQVTKKDSITILDDLNRAFHEYKRENLGTGGYWQTWDTVGEKGRDEIRLRLKNSKAVGTPFNNSVVKNGRRENLPTIWVLNNCKVIAQAMRQWRWEEWTDPKSRSTKDAKNKPMQKFSHSNMVIEAIFKSPAFRIGSQVSHNRSRSPQYFNRGR